MDFKKINNISGWVIFGIAMIVYLLTVAPTASFWDCGEFIACSNELQVTHPPGAPLFLLIGRILAIFSFGNTANVAFMVNLASVLSGAFTVLFTFWIITMLGRKAMKNSDMDTDMQTVSIMFAGAVGALACTFADSIWFNSVEAEVYSMSSFFTALVVWLIFKWDAHADRPDHLRWIILIAYVMGLSIGVHLLNLLTIPALALVYYFRKFEFSWPGILATLGISVGILVFIQYGIIQYTFSIAWAFEKFFTGTVTRAGVETGGMGLPMGFGAFLFAFLVLVAILGLLYYSIKNKKVVLNTVVLSYMVIMLGFSSYSLIFIRSNADPGIDMNNPENILTFLSYMKREQYGNRPLFKGTLYSALPDYDRRTGRAKMKDGAMRYTMIDGQKKYVEDDQKQEYSYKSEDLVLFPRMYSANDPKHYNSSPFGYKNFVKSTGKDPKSVYDDKPTRKEDMRFFREYQVSHMYLRYFMWNFAGRESDIQEANWEDGLIRNASNQSTLMKTNKGKNHYFMLPLILGMLGLVWQFVSDKKDLTIIGVLFLMTSFAIIIYLNQTPPQPRERDYSYAGSFQTFCIWIGFGVLFIVELLRKYLGKMTPYIAGGACLLVPLLMGFQNWDDHTRKGRMVDIEFAYNLLNSCEKNGILFTGGDNDTFPLWYIQEVEGVRTDVRVVNLELLVSDWYIEQMKSQTNESAPLPITMEKKSYAGEKGLIIQNYPSRKITLPSDVSKLVQKGEVTADEAALIEEDMVWDFKSRSNSYILRKDSVMIDVIRNIATNGWDRPIYFANTIPSSHFLNLADYFRLEGLAYRLLPIKKNANTPNDIYYGRIGQDIMFKRLTEEFKYTGLNNTKVNFDEHIRGVIIGNYRNAFFRLASTYVDQINAMRAENNRLSVVAGSDTVDSPEGVRERIAENQRKIAFNTDKVEKLITFADENISYDAVPPNVNYMIIVAQLLDASGLNELATKHYGLLRERSIDELRYMKANRIRIDQNNLTFKAALLTVQFLARTSDFDAATQMAKEIKEITGSDVGNDVINREKMQLQLQR